MKKFFTVALALLMVFSVQLIVAAADKGALATPIETSKVYPKDVAKNLNYKGTVTINAKINAEGDVIETVVMRSAGRPKVDKAAMEAASQWKFKPALDKDGKPMDEVWYMIKFEAKDFN